MNSIDLDALSDSNTFGITFYSAQIRSDGVKELEVRMPAKNEAFSYVHQVFETIFGVAPTGRSKFCDGETTFTHGDEYAERGAFLE